MESEKAHNFTIFYIENICWLLCCCGCNSSSCQIIHIPKFQSTFPEERVRAKSRTFRLNFKMKSNNVQSWRWNAIRKHESANSTQPEVYRYFTPSPHSTVSTNFKLRENFAKYIPLSAWGSKQETMMWSEKKFAKFHFIPRHHARLKLTVNFFFICTICRLHAN